MYGFMPLQTQKGYTSVGCAKSSTCVDSRHQHAHRLIKNKPAQRRHSQGEGIRQTDGHPTTAPEPAHFHVWGEWGSPKSIVFQWAVLDTQSL